VLEADNIIFIQDSHVTEIGSHDDLLNKRGSYWKAWRKQALQSTIRSPERVGLSGANEASLLSRLERFNIRNDLTDPLIIETTSKKLKDQLVIASDLTPRSPEAHSAQPSQPNQTPLTEHSGAKRLKPNAPEFVPRHFKLSSTKGSESSANDERLMPSNQGGIPIPLSHLKNKPSGATQRKIPTYGSTEVLKSLRQDKSGLSWSRNASTDQISNNSEARRLARRDQKVNYKIRREEAKEAKLEAKQAVRANYYKEKARKISERVDAVIEKRLREMGMSRSDQVTSSLPVTSQIVAVERGNAISAPNSKLQSTDSDTKLIKRPCRDESSLTDASAAAEAANPRKSHRRRRTRNRRSKNQSAPDFLDGVLEPRTPFHTPQRFFDPETGESISGELTRIADEQASSSWVQVHKPKTRRRRRRRRAGSLSKAENGPVGTMEANSESLVHSDGRRAET
jgi:hypothetical protein